MRCFMSIPVTFLRHIVSIKWRETLWQVDFKIKFAEWLPGMKMKVEPSNWDIILGT